ncbi:MAG TPA: type IV secretion system DNA-binding domain-containing protein [Pyrinomonadaceae bacterium]|nr:type IV secretion system DNA-binding domain-containing protein [Pyrinomonadaceae bacterium]
MIELLKNFLGANPRSAYTLTVPRKEENEGLLLLGDPGTGKSQILHQLIRRIAGREQFEAVVIYDPVGEFLEHHYNPNTDLILNPLDARSPYWNPALEVSDASDEIQAAERYFVAEGFCPDHPHTPPTSQFFNESSRSILACLLAAKPEPEELVRILANDAEIDRLVAGTELAHLIDKSAKAQRAGVLGSLVKVGESVRLLPSRKQAKDEFTFHEWAQQRDRRLFITSTHTTRDALRRLQAAQFNILIGKLLSVNPKEVKRPCWIMVDEAHSLKRLPALETALVEGRKCFLKIVLGTQNKAQLEQWYDRAAATILAAPHTKSFLRTGEAESAKWVSDMIGRKEIEKPRVSATASVQPNGRDSLSYSRGIEQHVVVTPEQIAALPNLNGYWKYGDAVVPFRIEPMKLTKRTDAFVPRRAQQKTTPAPLPESPIAPSKQLAVAPPKLTPNLAPANEHDLRHETDLEIDLIPDPDELDIKF